MDQKWTGDLRSSVSSVQAPLSGAPATRNPRCPNKNGPRSVVSVGRSLPRAHVPRHGNHHPLCAQVWHPGTPEARVLRTPREHRVLGRAHRKQIKSTESDLLRLYNARFLLQQRWRQAVVLAPYMDTKGVSPCRGGGSARSIYNHRYSSRPRHWRKMMLESNVVEAGMGDPLRYDASSRLTKEQKEAWCRGRRTGWTDMLAVKRTEWWVSFGELMELA